MTSPIGLGAVPATIYKKPLSNVCDLYDECITELKSAPMEEENWFENDFFQEKPKTNDAKLDEQVKSIKGRNKMVDDIEKQIKRQKYDTGPEKVEVHPAVIKYYDECKRDWQYGSVGRLPQALVADFPVNVENFIETKEGNMLHHFCKRFVK